MYTFLFLFLLDVLKPFIKNGTRLMFPTFPFPLLSLLGAMPNLDSEVQYFETLALLFSIRRPQFVLSLLRSF